MILAVVQARTSSRRFPGKVLAPLHGAPMIIRQLERVARAASLDRVVVATSTHVSDDPLVRMLDDARIGVHRGPLDDVVARFAGAVRAADPDHVVRLTADCPLTDPAVIDLVVAGHLAEGVDYTSNVRPPTFPDGLDVECLTATAFAKLADLPLTGAEREHVTLGVHRRPDEFTMHNVIQSPDRSALRWTVDIPDDLEFVAAVYAELYDATPSFGQGDILDLIRRHPGLDRTERDLARNSGLEAGE